MGAELHKKLQYFFLILSITLCTYLGYMVQRHQSFTLITSFGVLFLIYWYLYYRPLLSVKFLVIFAIVLRLLLLFSIPILSDDIYRFIWDGRLLQSGIHPFSNVPSWFVNHASLPNGLSLELYNKLNSPDYFTIYPPVGQFLFWLSAFSKTTLGSAFVIRAFVLLSEVGSIYLLKRLCDIYNVPRRGVLLYALNPLVILELTGNLHLEAFMIFFTLFGLYLYKKEKIVGSGIGIALAIASKLVPLILLPVFLRRLSLKNLIILYSTIVVFLFALFFPIYDEALVQGMTASISLYFKKFEFNASIYYLVREVGYWIKGYNIIATAGPWLSAITFVAIMVLAVFSDRKKTSIPTVWMWTILIYFLFATIIHPWYATSLVALSVLTRYRFPILWSGLIFLSYLGYSETGFEENMLVVSLEYGILFIFIIYELYREFGNGNLFGKPKAFS